MAMGWVRRIVLGFALLVAALPAAAQEPPAEVEELRRLLGSPAVQAWLQQAPEAEAASAVQGGGIDGTVGRMQAHRRAVLEVLPAMPREIAAAVGRLSAEAADHGTLVVMVLVSLLVVGGLVVEWRFLRVTRSLRKHVLGSREDTVPERLGKLGLRVVLVLGAVLAFSAGSLGVLLMIDLPELVREVALRALLAVIGFRLSLYAFRIALAPGAPERRVVPVDDALAAFWLSRLVAVAGLLLAGAAVVTSLMRLGAPDPVPLIVAYGFGAAVWVIAVVVAWQRADQDGAITPREAFLGVVWTIWATALLLLWVSGGMHPFWFLLTGGLLILTIRVVNLAVNHLLRPATAGGDDGSAEESPPSVLAAVIERGARAWLIIGAATILFWAWGIRPADVLEGDDRRAVIARVVISVALIAGIFDFIWHVASTAIDSFIREAEGPASPDPDTARHRARLRTLLPILRNVLQVGLGGLALLMVLAALGVEIAPLIAGAGILGVAIGFGAQGMVKDIIAGLFFLLDDAFRVGEYIVTSGYKGTVESFSLRSLKLRHHRGYLYTIPFGSLGAIQNMSRDWVIDKLVFTVPFGTDVARIKKLVKQVGAELQADPDLAPNIIETLKSQGADQIGDSGLIVKLKFKAVPGEQFLIRRRANVLVQKVFAENGIEFAFPTVRVMAEHEALEDEQAAAAARRAAALAASG
jgi:small-conductance mechanosensitive channel